MDASETLWPQIRSAAKALADQCQAIQSFVKSGNEDAQLWAKCEGTSNVILDYYSEKTAYAKALGGVARRRAKKDDEQATALAREAAEAREPA